MLNDQIQQSLIEEAEPIINGMGFSLVELKYGRSTHQNHVFICVYRPEGVGINDCTLISKNLLPRLEINEWLNDLRLQVSSPGVNRVIKRKEEFSIFQGKGVRLRLKNTEEWSAGIIDNVNEDGFVLKQKGEINIIRFKDILKAKLDYSQEG